jgi:hypothetical protein
MVRLGIFASHPIQYFAPLWRALAATPELDVLVHFFSDQSVRGGVDSGFGVAVAWDVPVLDGYASRFISRKADLSQPASVRLPSPKRLLQEGQFDQVMIHGYAYRFERQVVQTARRLGISTLMRGELTDTKHLAAPWYRRVARDGCVYCRAGAGYHGLFAAFLSQYQRLWKAQLGSEVWWGRLFRRQAEHLSDSQINEAFQLVSGGSLDQLIRDHATFNWHGGLIQALFSDQQIRSFLWRVLRSRGFPFGRQDAAKLEVPEGLEACGESGQTEGLLSL